MEEVGGLQVRNVWEMDILQHSGHMSQIIALQDMVSGGVDLLNWDGFKRMRDNQENIIFLALCQGEKIVAMAQATVIHNLRGTKVLVDSVAVAFLLQKQGVGKQLMEALAAAVWAKWPSASKIMLTSGTQRGTSSFYTGLGYIPREAARATVVYELGRPT